MDNDVCLCCGLRYKNFICSLKTFAEVKEQMYSFSEDSRDWKYRRKKGVLGYWHMIKKREWQNHLDECRENFSFDNAVIDNWEFEEY